MYSVRYCDVDENGVRHLALCRVIMGNMEILQPGTGQFHPSSCEYDNGVDSIECPRYYVVWNMNMNTHIYPEFVVSFKVSSDAEGDIFFFFSCFTILVCFPGKNKLYILMSCNYFSMGWAKDKLIYIHGSFFPLWWKSFIRC